MDDAGRFANAGVMLHLPSSHAELRT